SGLQLLPRMHQRFPHPIVFELPNEQTLDRAAAWNAAAQQTRRKHARVVHDQQIAGRKELRQRSDRGMADGPGPPVETQEPRAAAIGGSVLRDQIRRKIKVECADIHGPIMDRDGSRRKKRSRVRVQWMIRGPQTALASTQSSRTMDQRT